MENNSAQKCGMPPKWRFELYDLETGELVFAGTDAECSAFAGASLTSAISKAYRNTRNATYHNYRIVDVTPPELAGDIYRNGVMLTGGGAQLHGLTEYLSEELKVEVTVSPDPVNCVALGTAMSLGINDKLETGFMDATPRIGRR